MLVLGIFVLAGFFVGCYWYLKHRESDRFNNGTCHCGGHFKLLTASSNARGYDCDACNEMIWVTWGVDVDYRYVESDISLRRKEKNGGSTKTSG